MPDQRRESPLKAGIGLKQFRSDGCLSYLVWDQASGDSALIDPCMTLVGEYRAELAEKGLRLTWLLDTHLHSDHFSASHMLARESAARIGMHESTPSERPTERFALGSKIQLGSIQIDALPTPGHSTDSISFLTTGLLFTGDALWISALADPALSGSDEQACLKSIRDTLAKLPGDTLVYPGHEVGSRLFSTLEVERARHPAFAQPKDAEDAPPTHKHAWVAQAVSFNQAKFPMQEAALPSFERARPLAQAPGGGEDRFGTISIEKYSHKLSERSQGNLFIDVREPDEYLAGHIPGTRNIPLSELGLHLPELQRAKRVYLSCLSGQRSQAASRTLVYVGLRDVINVTGGFHAWSHAGNPVKEGQEP